MKKEVLLRLARAVIAESVGIAHDVDLQKLLEANPWLKEKGACFVTLTTGHAQLRGCIGSVVAHRPLVEDIIHNAKAAALDDPRFPSLSKEEFEKITIEVSLLTPPQPLAYETVEELREKIRPHVDGIILRHGSHQATYLPQVWEQLPDFDAFFRTLCMKAGMGGDCLAHHPDIFTYQVEEYKED